MIEFDENFNGSSYRQGCKDGSLHGLLELFRKRSFLSACLSSVAMAYWILKGNVFLLFKLQLLFISREEK